MIAEERQVELLDRDGRASNTLHPYIGEIDEEVTPKESDDLGKVRVKFIQAVVAGLHIRIAPARNHPLFPAELLAKRARWIR